MNTINADDNIFMAENKEAINYDIPDFSKIGFTPTGFSLGELSPGQYPLNFLTTKGFNRFYKEYRLHRKITEAFNILSGTPLTAINFEYIKPILYKLTTHCYTAGYRLLLHSKHLPVKSLMSLKYNRDKEYYNENLFRQYILYILSFPPLEMHADRITEILSFYFLQISMEAYFNGARRFSRKIKRDRPLPEEDGPTAKS